MKQKLFWLKLIGIVLLLHVVLILLSIIEVAIFSYLITPGKDTAFYSAHAKVSAPWIAAIFGSLFIFLLVKRFIKKISCRPFKICSSSSCNLHNYRLFNSISFIRSGFKNTDVSVHYCQWRKANCGFNCL